MKKKAVILVSGGLDSQLAVAIMQREGMDVIPLSCYSVFSSGIKGETTWKWVGILEGNFGVKVVKRSFEEELLKVVKSPKFGYGAGINPCIDCKIAMFIAAKSLMEETGASFVVTGEVVGQRPMSQMRQAIEIIERESGLERLILRPLSAKLFPLTIPEEAGIVNRENMYAIRGRGRKKQIELAKEFGISDYPQPAGGCILTERDFGKKMRKLLRCGNISYSEYLLIQSGRFFISSDLSARFYVARDKHECELLEKFAGDDDMIFKLADNFPGPVAVLSGDKSDGNLKVCAGYVKYYSKKRKEEFADIEYFVKREGKILKLRVG